MDKNSVEQTISDSKEESIAKAIRLLQNSGIEKPPLTRPDISTPKTILYFVTWFLAACLFVFLCLYLSFVFDVPAYVSHPIAVLGWLMIVAFNAKKTVRNAVLLYQKYAPEKMRNACLFVPSCSEYMLLAVEKYGVVVGVYKGLRRVLRCHHPNGGEDYP